MTARGRAARGARFLFDPRGRASRKGIWLGLLLPYLAGSIVLGAISAPAQLVWGAAFLWPLFVAVPVKRFHDMGRAWWWVLVFGAGMAFGAGYLWWDLGKAAGAVGLTAGEAWADMEGYAELAREAVERGERSARRGPLLSASGWGGLSTVLIFGAIEFGWLYLVPGQAGPNAYGPPPRAEGPNPHDGAPRRLLS